MNTTNTTNDMEYCLNSFQTWTVYNIRKNLIDTLHFFNNNYITLIIFLFVFAYLLKEKREKDSFQKKVLNQLKHQPKYEVEEVEEETKHGDAELYMQCYKKCLLITGNTIKYKDELKKYNGKYNATLKGWVFSPKHENTLLGNLPLEWLE